ncbi:MAG: class I SAM-dependent methyltransferase [Sphingomonadaceae bacterium]
MTAGQKHEAPAAWPAEDIEPVGACPGCGSSRRAPMFENLEDRIFGAPGRWTMWRCEDCRSAYLDPRPTAQSMYRAYREYYTHEDARSGEPPSAGLAGGLKRRLVNGYANRRYATARRPALPTGALLPLLRPALARSIDYGFRHLPRPWGGRRLLDIGCGNGAFLLRAREAGWRAAGCDFDPQAVRRARAHGFEIRQGGVERFADREGEFEAVTLSHVLEHVHDPRATLLAIYDLLAPGGFLFIDTPNADALGLAEYGEAWRGLEPPRHLVIFTWQAVRAMLSATGFAGIVERPFREAATGIWRKSELIRRGSSPYAKRALPKQAFAHLPPAARIAPGRTEFVTVTARRP